MILKLELLIKFWQIFKRELLIANHSVSTLTRILLQKIIEISNPATDESTSFVNITMEKEIR